jgi:hypothetical protein
VTQLDATAANSWALRAEAAGIDVRIMQGDATRVADTFLAVEVGSANGHVRWATREAIHLCPSSHWGGGDDLGGALVVRRLGALPVTESRLPVAGELRRAEAGQFTEATIRNQLDGDLGEVGRQFWALIATAVPALQLRLASALPIAEISWTDRYVRSPLVGRIVYEVVRALARLPSGQPAPGGISAQTRLTLATTWDARSGDSPRFVQHDWQDADTQRTVLKSLLGSLCRADITVGDRRNASHHRELVLRWADGARLIIRLDQGFGFLKTQRIAAFRFGAPQEQQADLIVRETVGVRNAGGPVPLYVSGPL